MQETEPDRPSRKIEHFIQRTNELYVRLNEVAKRYRTVAERLELGEDIKPEGTQGMNREATVAVPELAELADNIERIREQVDLLEQMVNILEGV